MYQRTADHNAVVNRGSFVATWKFDARGRINGGLALVGNTLVLDTLAGEVIALDVGSGRQLWKAQVDNVVMSTPIATDNLVFVGTGRSRQPGARSRFTYVSDPSVGAPFWGRPEGDHIIALDLATGAVRWRYRTAGEDMPSPALAARRIAFANGDFHAYGLDANSGVAEWRTDLNGISTMASSTVVSNHAVLFSTCRDFHTKSSTESIDVTDGRVLWQAPFGNCDSSPTVGAGRVFVSGTIDAHDYSGFGGRGAVFALDSSTGRLLWRFRSDGAGPYTAVGSSERAIAGTYAGQTYFQALPTLDRMIALDVKGNLRWGFRTQAPVKMSAVEAKSRLYFGDTAGLLYVLDSRSGRLLAVRIFDEPFSTAPPVIVGDTLIIVNGSSVYAMPMRELNP